MKELDTALMLVAVFTAGTLMGYNLNMPAFEVRNQPINEPYNESEIITYEGAFKMSGVTWNFSHDENPFITGQVRPEQNQIFIKTGRTARQSDITCNHEILHVWFPKFEHDAPYNPEDPIYRLEDEIDTEICNKVIKKALRRS